MSKIRKPINRGVFSTSFGYVGAIVVGLAIAFAYREYFMNRIGYPFTYKTKPAAFDKASICVVSYADGDAIHTLNQMEQAASGVKHGANFIFMYNKSLLDPAFVHKNAHIFAHKEGAGLWVWKPWIILDVMKRMPLGSIIFYVDAGLVFTNDITKLAEFVHKYEKIMVIRRPHLTNKTYTKKQCLRLMNQDKPEVWIKPQIHGAFIVMKNTLQNQQLVAKWLVLCQDERLLVDNTQNSKVEHPDFVRHLHDQAILSMMFEGNGKHMVDATEAMLACIYHHHRRDLSGHPRHVLTPLSQKETDMHTKDLAAYEKRTAP